MMNDNVESQFEFVKEIDPLMHALLLSAETSYYSAPAHTLVQTRKFAESLVNQLARANKIEFTEQTDFATRIRRLENTIDIKADFISDLIVCFTNIISIPLNNYQVNS